MEEAQFSLAALKPSSSYSPFPLTLLGFQVESLYETGWIVPGCVLCLQRTKFCSQHLLPPPAKLMQAAIGHGYGPLFGDRSLGRRQFTLHFLQLCPGSSMRQSGNPERHVCTQPGGSVTGATKEQWQVEADRAPRDLPTACAKFPTD